jgi:hypothetical protein
LDGGQFRSPRGLLIWGEVYYVLLAIYTFLFKAVGSVMLIDIFRKEYTHEKMYLI